MNIYLYIIIFLSKVFENALATLRLIVVANGRKVYGAILQFIIALVWVTVTGTVLVGIQEDPLKIVFFSLGSMVGSFFGSFLEEKMAIGSNTIMAIIDKDLNQTITEGLRQMGYAVTSVTGQGKDKERNILYVIATRKKKELVIKIIKEVDPKAMIVSSSTSSINGGFVS